MMNSKFFIFNRTFDSYRFYILFWSLKLYYFTEHLLGFLSKKKINYSMPKIFKNNFLKTEHIMIFDDNLFIFEN